MRAGTAREAALGHKVYFGMTSKNRHKSLIITWMLKVLSETHAICRLGTAVLGVWALAATSAPLEEIHRFADGLVTYRADFEQSVVNEVGAMVEHSRGKMALAAPNRLRWHYLEAYEQLIVADGRRIWAYDVDLEQITVKTQDQDAADSPLYVLLDPALLEERYELRSNGRIDDLELIELIPRDRRTDFESIELGLRDGILQTLSIRDAFGQQTLIRFSGIERNPDLEEGLFEFEPPPGVDVIGDLDLDSFVLPDS